MLTDRGDSRRGREGYGEPEAGDTPSATAAEMGPPDGAFLVAYEHGQPVACGGLKRLDDHTAEIKRMYVIPEARSRGLARLLLGALEEEARRLGYRSARLDTGPRQPHARMLYESEGYAAIPAYNRNPFAHYWGREAPLSPHRGPGRGPHPARHSSYADHLSGRPSSAPAPARLFIALDLPDADRNALAAWRDAALEGRSDLRAVATYALHVTLAFLGSRPEHEIATVAERGLSQLGVLQAPVLWASEVKPIPRSRPRLFALDLVDEDGRAGAVQAAVSSALAEAGLCEPEKRPFWPHLTLARVRGSGRREKRSPPRVEALEAPSPPRERIVCSQVTLYRSHLSRHGARYEALARHELG